MAEGEAGQAEATETTEAEGTEEQQTPEWQAAIDNLGEQFSSRLDEFGQQFQQAPQPEQQYEDEGYEEQFDPERLYNDDGEMDPEAAQQMLRQITQQESTTAAQQAMQPLLDKVTQMEVQLGARDLENEFPQLKEPETAKAVLDAADQLEEETGIRGIGQHPSLLRMVFKAMKADERASQEVPAGTAADGLESAQGAAAPTPEIDPAQGIVDAKKGNTFWGT